MIACTGVAKSLVKCAGPKPNGSSPRPVVIIAEPFALKTALSLGAKSVKSLESVTSETSAPESIINVKSLGKSKPEIRSITATMGNFDGQQTLSLHLRFNLDRFGPKLGRF